MPLVRVTSHRARHKLYHLLGSDAPGFYSWERGGEWREIPAGKYEDALKIIGIKPAGRNTTDLRPYVAWNDTKRS